ncbi:hypothetical protein [Leptolyngbya sp. CCY15150]|uniref:hypothetical protein n=1 Tax=Leptolyngbya sp. CCY15150 TaxID=2767772 RepID=UPI001951415E|nr:hypothetical protein [Leptolyngbya sp. CCY15150]
MDRSKLVAIATGAVAVLLSVAYLLIVQLLDFRGEMKPAPITEESTTPVAIVRLPLVSNALQQHPLAIL